MNLSPKQSEVRHVINENNLAVCAILESHIASSRLDVICKRVFRHWYWASNSSSCFKGTRIILGWNADIVDTSIISQSDQVMHTRIWIKAERKELFCSFIYAHNRYTHRRGLWDSLCMHKCFINNRPWCILGDFNAALNIEDASAGLSFMDISMREFKECIEEIELIDVPRSGLQFTWNQKPQGSNGILKKLDRVMANVEFSNEFIGNYAVFQPYGISDHSPAVLRIPLQHKIYPKPFKFANVVTTFPRFKEVVKEGWSDQVCGFYMFRVVKKLKSLKKPLRKLLYDKGNLHDNVNKLRIEMDRVQQDLDVDPTNQDLRDEEAVYVRAFTEALIMEERFLKQKAKIEWLKVGDSNSAYFHKSVKGRTSRNRIDVVTDLGGDLVTGDGVPAAFVSHYEAFLGQPGITSPFDSNNLFLNRLTSDQALDMIKHVTAQEVKEAIFSMGNDKSPGPDGYTACFFKECWDIVASDVVCAVQEFFTNGNLLKELNHTIIALIPKVNSPSRINDYRPISCCNVLFKCITKIISNRIKESLKGLISPNQSAFVPGRRISDNILLTQELMHNYHLDRGPSRILMGLDIIAIVLIWRSLTFANDLFIFAHGDPYSAKVIMEAMEEFKNASRLTPSLPKSTAYFCNVLNHTKLSILQILPFEEGRLPVKYLGVPLVSSRLVFRDCKELVDRICSRINDWKNKSLSAAGRLQLVRSRDGNPLVQ
ncbi:RNA-directed DNA polymerase, eukaryota, reverse transcriptase zinc-binding domain protein [Tanacetum coccineum]